MFTLQMWYTIIIHMVISLVTCVLLQSKLDLDSLSVAGHSFGASTCIAALAQNNNFK